jgi:GMP synthase (glutamine-hydrolysing)
MKSGELTKKLFVFKAGSTLSELSAKKGDFEDWARDKMTGTPYTIEVINIQNGCEMPDYDQVAGLVITGSHDNVTEHKPWSERAAAWLPGLVERDIPTLGICFGHQLLAYALGGEVADTPYGDELGLLDIYLDPDANQDGLFGGLPATIQVLFAHSQSVLRLPQGAVRLASDKQGSNHAYRLEKQVWGVQFHPEFDAEVVRAYIEESRESLQAQGQNVDHLLETCVDSPYGVELFKRFVAVVNQQD